MLTRGEQVALIRRPPKGLLGGMLALPTTDWRSTPWTDTEALAVAPVSAGWKDAGVIEHVFTHFALTLRVMRVEGDAPDMEWTDRSGLEAMPSVFLKAAKAGLLYESASQLY